MGREPAAATRAVRARRVVRLLWPDGNPLRRTTDRVEALILVSLTIAFAMMAPFAVIVTGHAVYGAAVGRAQAERIAWHRAPAVLLEQAAAIGYFGPPEAPARWTAADGGRRTGMIAAPPNARAGSTVRIWIDASGRQTGPPLTMAQVRGEAAVFAALAPFALALLVLSTWALARSVLSRRRLGAWEAEWRATGPQWTRQL